MKTDLRTLLILSFECLKISAHDGVLAALESYAREVIRWNRRVNLTGAKTPAEFVRGPLFDALSLLPVLEPDRTLVDIGSGGGLPGIPARLVHRNIQVTLVEPRSKRVAFLNHVCHYLEIKAEVLPVRAEKLGDRHWQGAVAQAVWSPEDWIPLGAGRVDPGGAVYVLSAGPIERAAIPPGLVVEKGVEISRPFDGAMRYSTKLVAKDR